MRLSSTYRKILAFIVAVLVLTGTTGFNTEELICKHCCSEYRIIFFQDEAEKHISCEVNTTTSCCSDSPEDMSDAAFPEGPDFLDEECCNYDYGSVSLDDRVPLTFNYVHFDLSLYASAPEMQFISTGTFFKVKIRSNIIPCRDQIIFNSQFLT